MDIDKMVEESVKDYCKNLGYSDRLTELLLNLVEKLRRNELEDGDLGQFVSLVNSIVNKDGLQ